MIVVTRYACRQALGAAKAVGQIWEAPELHLFSNNISPTDTNVVGDFTAAVFTGNPSPVTLTFGSVFENSNGYAEMDSQLVNVVCTAAPVSPVTVYGYWIDDGAGNLLAAERFSTPQTIANANDGFSLVIAMTEVSQQT